MSGRWLCRGRCNRLARHQLFVHLQGRAWCSQESGRGSGPSGCPPGRTQVEVVVVAAPSAFLFGGEHDRSAVSLATVRLLDLDDVNERRPARQRTTGGRLLLPH